MISALQAGKRLCQLSRWTLNNQRLQKILYIAHTIYMGRYDGACLVIEPFQASDFGPISPKLYEHVDAFGARPIKNIFRTVEDFDDPEREDVLSRTLCACADLSPARLIGITHGRYSAWAKNYVPGLSGVVIPNRDILSEYAERNKSP